MQVFRVFPVAMVAAGALFVIPAAQAKPATCFTTDDGEYSCDFKALDDAGSFEITSSTTPSYRLLVDEPGVASGYANFGDRYFFLPGTYRRAEDDPACWDNSDTGARLCAW